jgi:hypothetical protein
MKGKLILTAAMLLAGYATYVHGYYLDNGGKLFMYNILELFPLWNIGTYLFWPAYLVISLIKPYTDLWLSWVVVGMWIIVHTIYAYGVSWILVELSRRIGYNSGHGRKNRSSDVTPRD